MVVYEGTGHPGVGSVVDLSNAEVARQLESEVILVLEGGIGNFLTAFLSARRFLTIVWRQDRRRFDQQSPCEENG